MYVHLIDLEKRPQGAGILGAEGDMPFESAVSPGCTVALRFREIRIIAQVLEMEADQFYVGQVLDFDGTCVESPPRLTVVLRPVLRSTFL